MASFLMEIEVARSVTFDPKNIRPISRIASRLRAKYIRPMKR